MKNRKELKEKLEQQRKYFTNRINKLKKAQIELTLKSILVMAKKEEIELKQLVVDQLINEMESNSGLSKQTMKVKFKSLPSSAILFMN